MYVHMLLQVFEDTRALKVVPRCSSPPVLWFCRVSRGGDFLLEVVTLPVQWWLQGSGL